MKLVLFDIDGTLMRAHGAGSRALLRAGQAICGPSFSLDGVTIGGGLDPMIFDEAGRAMGLSLAQIEQLHEAFRDRYLDELAHELSTMTRRPELLPGVVTLLASLATREDVAVGLLTGNYQRAVPLKFRAAGLGHTFVAGAFGDDARERHGLVPVALERFRVLLGRSIASSDVIVVGDTPRDVECALKNGARCLAVCTGYHAETALREAGAQRVAADLADPEVLLSWLRA